MGTTVSGNETTSSGGGIRDSAGVITISNSLIADNVANNVGGGILTTNTDLSIFNSTVSGNRGVGSSGGALRIFGDRSLDPAGTGESITQIVNSTVAFNESGFNGAISGEAKADSSVTIGFQNSIFSNNSGSPNFGSFFSGTTLVSAGHNISDDNSGNLNEAGDQPNTDPQLLTLADNGGPTRTHGLRLGSPASNAGSNALAVDQDGNPLTTDQRGDGFARILQGAVDVGAFESDLFAGEFVVSTNSDVVDNDFSAGQLSLREVINFANEKLGPDEITFDQALSGLVITLGGSQLEITDTLTIDASGLAGGITIDADGRSRVFQFASSDARDFEIVSLTITGGSTTGSDDGAGILFDSTGTLSVTNSTLSGNTAVRDGGGIFTSSGAVTVTNSTLSGNTAVKVMAVEFSIIRRCRDRHQQHPQRQHSRALWRRDLHSRWCRGSH